MRDAYSVVVMGVDVAETAGGVGLDPGEFAVLRKRRDTKIRRAVGDVSVSPRVEPFHELHHLRNVGGCARIRVSRTNAKLAQRLVKRRDVRRSVRVDVLSGGFRVLDDAVVDARDVHDLRYAVAAPFEIPAPQIL